MNYFTKISDGLSFADVVRQDKQAARDLAVESRGKVRKLVSMQLIACATVAVFWLIDLVFGIIDMSAILVLIGTFQIAIAASIDKDMVENCFHTPSDGGAISALFFFVVMVVWLGGTYGYMYATGTDSTITDEQVKSCFIVGAMYAFAIYYYYRALHRFNDPAFAESIFMSSFIMVPVMLALSGKVVGAKTIFGEYQAWLAGIVFVGCVIFAGLRLRKDNPKEGWEVLGWRLFFAVINALVGATFLSVWFLLQEQIPHMEDHAFLTFAEGLGVIGMGSGAVGFMLLAFRKYESNTLKKTGEEIESLYFVVMKYKKEVILAEGHESFSKFFILLAASVGGEDFVELSNFLYYTSLPAFVFICCAVMDGKYELQALERFYLVVFAISIFSVGYASYVSYV